MFDIQLSSGWLCPHSLNINNPICTVRGNLFKPELLACRQAGNRGILLIYVGIICILSVVHGHKRTASLVAEGIDAANVDPSVVSRVVCSPPS